MALEVVLRALNYPDDEDDHGKCGAKTKHHLPVVFAFTGEETQVAPRPQEQTASATYSGLLNRNQEYHNTKHHITTQLGMESCWQVVQKQNDRNTLPALS